MFCFKVLLGNELLDFVDGNGLVNRAARTSRLAATIAHTSADGRERIFFLDEFKGVAIASFGRHTEISLHRNMGRAGNFTGSGAGIVALNAVVVLIIPVPVSLTPELVVRKILRRIGKLAMHGGKLLPQLRRSRRTYLHAATTRHAFFRVHMSHKRRTGKVRRIEQLRGAQSIANVYVTVTDGKDFVLAVNVGDLMDKAVFLGTLANVDNLVVGDIVAFAGFHAIIGHVAYGNAPVLGIVGTTIAADALGQTTRARRCRISIIFFEPMRDMLHRNRMVNLLNGTLNGNHVHTYAGTSRRHQLRSHFQRQIRHTLKQRCYLRMLLQLALIHDGKLSGAGHKHG